MPESQALIPTLRNTLIQDCRNGNAWCYRAGAAPAVEPTAFAALALGMLDHDDPAVAAAVDWLARRQQPDGALGVTARSPQPGWPTAAAVLLWSTIVDSERAKARAVAWLLEQSGLTVPAQADRVFGHDPSIPGWSWTPGTSPWLEPTASSVIALRKAGQSQHRRTREGLRLIVDRAIPSGGWNYGNNAVFGHDLRPQPGPTGLALLALAGTNPPRSVVEPAIAYLGSRLPQTRAGMSLGWGILGLRAWNRGPASAATWIMEAGKRAATGPSPTLAVALLLLAAAERGLEPFLN